MRKDLFSKQNRLLAVSIFMLAWPTMLEQLMQTAVQYIDTAMVGSLGTHATAAVGATTTINWLISGTVSALGVGFLSFVARSYGANRRDLALRASGQMVLACLSIGSLFTLFCLSLSPFIPGLLQVEEGIRELASRYFFILYAPMLPRTAILLFGTLLRAVGDSKTPMRVGVFMNLTNVVLNFFLIYPSRILPVGGSELRIWGAGLGVSGAALASAIAFLLGGIFISVALFRHPDISPKGQSLRPDPQILRPCLRVAFPNMLQRFATSLGYVIFASMINALGEIATAAHTIANTVESAFYIPGYGMQTAAATLAGNAAGAKDRARMRDTSRMILLMEVLLMLFSGTLLFFFAPQMVGLFSRDPAVLQLGSRVLRMVALSEPFFGAGIIMEGLLLGQGNTKTPFFYNLLGMWGVRIIGTFLCTRVFQLGLVSAWCCMILHNLLLFSLFLFHFRKGIWKANNGL